MIVIFPGAGIGVGTERPILGFTLGYLRTTSALAPITSIISSEPGSVLSRAPESVVSVEELNTLQGVQTLSIVGRTGVYVLRGEEIWELVSDTFIGTVTGDLPADIVAALPAGIIGESATGVESDEPDNEVSEEP
jgi:hypothetical protein